MRFGLQSRTAVCFGIGGALALCGGNTLGAQGTDCAAVYASQMKLLKTPHHGYSVDSSMTDARLHQGKAKTSEQIVTASSIYTMYEGKWRLSHVSIARMQKMEEKNIRNAKSTCTAVGSESVNGEAAAVYQMHSVTDAGTTDSRNWVSKSRGLPLRTVTQLDVGGAMGKSIISQRYDYSNVAVPAGAQ